MINNSRIDIYNYLYNLLFGVVTENVYSMGEPQELTESDAKDGFVVINVEEIHDDSEFSGEAYGWVRCYIEAFVPPISRGRLDVEKYKEFEDRINNVISEATYDTDGDYYIQDDSIISIDTEEMSNANNTYFTFIKSFIIIIDKQE